MNNEVTMRCGRLDTGYEIEYCNNQIISFHKSDHKLNILNGGKGVGH